ncbi:MAG: MarC family protein [Lentisphaeria bacterium]|nr:MarC family protein [Lentisphaeria bacterium]
MEIAPVFENAFYLLALLNPPSKIMFLAAYEPKLSRRQNFELSWKSSAAALLILLIIAAAGHFILSRIFRVELYSLQITGGLVVFVIGWTAVNEGRFLKRNTEPTQNTMTDISLVPLAAPLIAGPGMIAATIAGSFADGFAITSCSLAIAIFINFLLMLCSSSINAFLTRTHMLGPLIRLTGLITSAVAMQMLVNGVRTCFKIS